MNLTGLNLNMYFLPALTNLSAAQTTPSVSCRLANVFCLLKKIANLQMVSFPSVATRLTLACKGWVFEFWNRGGARTLVHTFMYLKFRINANPGDSLVLGAVYHRSTWSSARDRSGPFRWWSFPLPFLGTSSKKWPIFKRERLRVPITMRRQMPWSIFITRHCQ